MINAISLFLEHFNEFWKKTIDKDILDCFRHGAKSLVAKDFLGYGCCQNNLPN